MLLGVFCVLSGCAGPYYTEIGRGEVYSVIEISFTGKTYDQTDTPVKDVDFWVRFQHESGKTAYKIHGFWDGDGSGGAAGSVFKVRFCPTAPGKWNITEVYSNLMELSDQKEGDYITAVTSSHKGFWVVDTASPGNRWYKRSDGSHQYIYGNTHYSFVSEYKDTGSSDSGIIFDITAGAKYFNKLRFSIHGDRYPHPVEKPFFNNFGEPTDDGNYSFRPNPKWFHERIDTAVQTAYELDMIADLILNGPDTEDSRSILHASENGGDPTPFLKYIAARYGSYPNVWICLSNEWNKRRSAKWVSNKWENQKAKLYSASQITKFGKIIRKFLPYATPLSVHGYPDKWYTEFNTKPSWNEHVIIQHKLKDLSESSDSINRSHLLGGENKPVINDELAYEGDGDGWSEEDVIESHLGAFLGGGYGTTGFKRPSNKKGHYSWGSFKASEHTAAYNLLGLLKKLDSNITFWKHKPVPISQSIFENTSSGFRTMQWRNHEYVLGTDESYPGIRTNLPPGTWEVKYFDAIEKEEKLLTSKASGVYKFDAPSSRAVLFLFKKIEPR